MHYQSATTSHQSVREKEINHKPSEKYHILNATLVTWYRSTLPDQWSSLWGTSVGTPTSLPQYTNKTHHSNSVQEHVWGQYCLKLSHAHACWYLLKICLRMRKLSENLQETKPKTTAHIEDSSCTLIINNPQNPTQNTHSQKKVQHSEHAQNTEQNFTYRRN